MSDSLYGAPDSPLVPAAAKAPTLLEQIEGVFTAPKALFERLHRAPSWVPALLVGVTLAVLITVAWALKVDVDAMIRPALESNPKISPDQVDSIIQMQSRFILPFGLLGSLIGIPVITLIAGLIYWGFGAWQREGEAAPTFLQGLSAAAVVGLVRIPDALVIFFLCLFKPVGGHRPDQLTPFSVGYWIHAASPKVSALLYQLNVFNIATFVLLYLAMRHLLKAKPLGAALTVAVMVGFSLLGVAFAK